MLSMPCLKVEGGGGEPRMSSMDALSFLFLPRSVMLLFLNTGLSAGAGIDVVGDVDLAVAVVVVIAVAAVLVVAAVIAVAVKRFLNKVLY